MTSAQIHGELEVPAFDLVASLKWHRVGLPDPTVWTDATRYAVALHTPEGPATLMLEALSRTLVRYAVVGPGAATVIPHLPAICGVHDDPLAVLPLATSLPRLHDLLRRQKLVRMPRVPWAYETAIGTVLQQRVDFGSATQSWAGLCKRYGERAPGELGLMLAPSPERIASMPSFSFRELGIDGQRERAVRAVCERAERIAALQTIDEARTFFSAIAGFGPWTVESVLAIGYGDADAVPTGDFWLPHMVSNAMIGKARASDDEMLALLSPYRPHRYRLIKALYAGGFGAQRFAPRRPHGPGDPRRISGARR